MRFKSSFFRAAFALQTSSGSVLFENIVSPIKKYCLVQSVRTSAEISFNDSAVVISNFTCSASLRDTFDFRLDGTSGGSELQQQKIFAQLGANEILSPPSRFYRMETPAYLYTPIALTPEEGVLMSGSMTATSPGAYAICSIIFGMWEFETREEFLEASDHLKVYRA